MKVYIVRHTSVAINGFCYGQTDIPLNDTFETEAEIVRQKLKNIKYDAIISSPLSRCLKLATYCGYGNEVQLFDRLKEINMGEWEMRPWKDLDLSIFKEDWTNTVLPQGESFNQVLDRVTSFFDELKTRDYDTVIIFSHGGVINCARTYFGETDLLGAFDRLPDYGEVLEFELN